MFWGVVSFPVRNVNLNWRVSKGRSLAFPKTSRTGNSWTLHPSSFGVTNQADVMLRHSETAWQGWNLAPLLEVGERPQNLSHAHVGKSDWLGRSAHFSTAKHIALAEAGCTFLRWLTAKAKRWRRQTSHHAAKKTQKTENRSDEIPLMRSASHYIWDGQKQRPSNILEFGSVQPQSLLHWPQLCPTAAKQSWPYDLGCFELL